MKNVLAIATIGSISAFLTLSSCTVQEDMPAKPAPAAPAPVPAAKAEATAPAEKAPAKAKVEKASGDVGLLDMEKNYMILVTKEGKLITLDFDQKTKVTQITPTAVKAADIGLGSSATVIYEKVDDKSVATKLDFRPAKGE
jgi:hypothetical protein